MTVFTTQTVGTTQTIKVYVDTKIIRIRGATRYLTTNMDYRVIRRCDDLYAARKDYWYSNAGYGERINGINCINQTKVTTFMVEIPHTDFLFRKKIVRMLIASELNRLIKRGAFLNLD